MSVLLITFIFLSIMFLLFYFKRQNPAGKFGLWFVVIMIYSIYLLAIIFRPPVGDVGHYMDVVWRMSAYPLSLMPRNGPWTWSFTFYCWLIGRIWPSHILFSLGIFIIMVSVTFFAFKRYFDLDDSVLLLICYAYYPFFIVYLVSGVRQGLGMTFMLCGAIYLVKEKRLLAFIWLLLAPLLWHKGLWAPLIILMPALLIRNRKILNVFVAIFFLISILLSITNLNSAIILLIIHHMNLPVYYDTYFNTALLPFGFHYGIGFRWDFALFSMFPIVLYFMLKKSFYDEYKKDNNMFIIIYTLLNSILYLFSFIIFSDRFAVFSWFLMPMIIYRFCATSRHVIIKDLFIIVSILAGAVLLQKFSIYFYH